MIKFNLKKALAGRKLVTRSGIEVDQIAHFPTKVLYPVVVHLKGYDSVYQVDEDGTVPENSYFTYGSGTRKRSDYDLFMVPNKRTVYVNVYQDRLEAGVFSVLEDAEVNADHNTMQVIARAVPIVVEE
jgi:hypothetical protein